VTLGDVCEFKYGKSLPESARAGGNVPVYGSNGQVGNHDEAITSGPTIVIGRKGSFGEVKFSAGPCWPIDTTYYVDASATEADLRWLAYRLAALGLNKLNKAAAVPGLNREDAYRQRLLLPPLPEQRRIAEILDKADALRAKRRAALAQLDTLTQSIFLDMFGDPATNPKGWPKASLEELFEIARGGSPRPIDDYITDDPDGINWIMIGDTVEGGKYITSTRKRIRPEGARRSRAVKPGDFLLTNSMSFGRPYIMRTSGCIHDGWLVLSPQREDVEPNYFYALLGTQAVYAEFARRAPGATVKNLNIDLVRGVTVPVPPLRVQQKFAAIVASIERWASTYNRALADCDSLFASLQHRAFRGEL
jgi:type I restriction enzyme S subunit